ncbi:MAG TPA: hypothetical protein VGQ36_02620 [Thermoanaerobaculia bacterium]|jgi:hypothetical protein|nr:hypothetical protein [Thermoanaerobaculia bacterium]
MSKTNPNQEYYKTAGRTQSEGPDRIHTNEDEAKNKRVQEQFGKDPNHPAIRAKKK